MIIRPYGDAAVLVEPDDAAQVLALSAALRAEPGVLEVVPAARTALILAAPAELPRLAARARECAGTVRPATLPPGPQLVLDVHYDGPDLAATAAELGLDPAELVARHAGVEYVVAFCGFSPGFGYLTGSPVELHVARHAEPRTRVPAGSVGLAGEFTAVYPSASPGGWRLIGRTPAVLWDLDRDPPARLTPGTRVRFRPV